jgi:hypothetical protein
LNHLFESFVEVAHDFGAINQRLNQISICMRLDL